MFNIIYTVCGSMKSAKKISKLLLKNRKAVCVNILKDIKSFYIDDNKIKSSNEVALLIKTISSPKSVINFVKDIHEYDVPFITKLDIRNTNKKYLNWAKKAS
tara:strand:- start:2066 stop:2371 length:306 start_codon:yes stop_codon:yes gene_type:complete